MIDLSKVEGLTEEQQEAIKAAHEADISGLKRNNADLIAEKQATKQKAEEAERIRKEAERIRKETEEKAAQEKAASDGNTEELKKLLAEQEKRIKAEQEAFEQKTKKISFDSALKGLVNQYVIPDPAAQLYMENKFRESLDFVDGKLVHAHNGTPTGLDVEQQIKQILGKPELSGYLSGTKAVGGGATGGNGTGAGPRTMTSAEHDALALKDPQAAADFFLKDKGQIVG